MIYPEFLKKGDKVGICSISAGVGYELDKYLKSVKYLKDKGIKITEKGNVRVNDVRGGTVLDRVNALHDLYLDKNIDFIMCATGGDFAYEILPHVDLNIIKDNPKFFMGYSDPTCISSYITTKADIASIYGFNASSYEEGYEYIENNFKVISGKNIVQKSFKFFQETKNYGLNIFDQKVKWENDAEFKGRCFGGCLDVFKDLIGTPYIDIEGFNERYKDDGIVFFFDIYAMSAENVYRTLLQMKAANWFKYCKGILIGRVLFESSDTGMTYGDAYLKALDGIKYIYNADIGHSFPKMTLINGAVINVKSKKGKGQISFELI